MGWSKGPGNMSMYSSYLFERFCLFTYLPFLMYTAIRKHAKSARCSGDIAEI